MLKLLQEYTLYTLGLGLEFTSLSIKVHKINCSQNHIWQSKAEEKVILSRGYVPTYGNDAPMVFSPGSDIFILLQIAEPQAAHHHLTGLF